MKIHLLRRESITPIALYLARRDELPDSADRQLEFAAVLIYREREFKHMHMSSWWMRRGRPAPSPDSAFVPYDITEDAARDLTAMLDDAVPIEAPPRPYDLFGLKGLAVEGLRRTLRPRKADAFGWLVLAWLHRDMCDDPSADAAAAHAANLGASGDDLHERVRKLAWRLRSAAEGEAFTRYLTTEKAFCESERDAAMKDFDETKLPPALRELVPLARQIGVGDDACRGVFVRKMSARERRGAATLIARHATEIDAWLATREEPYAAEATAFFWLRAAGEELE